jgi:hypothetical protein
VSFVLPLSAKEGLVDSLVQMIRNHRLSEVSSTIDAYEDPIMMGSGFIAVVKSLYREHKDVTSMIMAGDMGLTYCLKKAALESDGNKTRQLKKLGQVIAFNTAVNCWPGWGDAGIVIEEAHISAGIGLAAECLNLVEELALKPREHGGAHWLIGALELAAGRFGMARAAFQEAQRVYLTDEATSAYALMARGYIALAGKADPQCRLDGADTLSEAMDRLRSEGSKDAIFFADQIATANRLLFES